MQENFGHYSVLLNETVDSLNINPDGVYVDCTLGGAGHSNLIASRLSEKGRLIGIDRDDFAIGKAKERLAKYGEHVDDHQLQLIEQFDEMELICPCDDTDKLAEAIDTAKHHEYNQYQSNTNTIIRSIEKFINDEVDKGNRSHGKYIFNNFRTQNSLSLSKATSK